MGHIFARTIFRTVLGSRLPITEGVLEVPGTDGTITIRRDRYGIPNIRAATDRDAWFALGFCQGQDRAFQIESLIRVVRGTSAALVGDDTVALDRLARRIGFRSAGAVTLALFDDAGRAGFAAFARGVNAGRDIGLARRPHEFTLLRGEPSTMDDVDITAMLALQAFALSANWDSELARLEILTADGEEALEAVDPRYPEWHPVTESPDAVAGVPIDGLRVGLELLRDVIGIGGASNNWALTSGLTSTGRPLLSNDPHSSPSLPPHWYLAHVATPEWEIAGAAFAGSPAFISAHNGHVAWGVTAGLVDNTDLFIEEIGPDGTTVRRGEDWIPCEVVREVIEVRGSDPVTEDVLVTPHGPIVGAALQGAHEAIAMAATWLRPQRGSSLLELPRAPTVAGLRAVLADYSGPSLNFVAADADGSIAWQLAGEAPVRITGRGALPLPAWVDGVGWEEEYVPFSSMPWVIAPDSGYLATANARPTTSDEPFLGVDWIEGYRMARINQIIEGSDDWDIDSTLQAQLDTTTLAWTDLRDHILPLPRTSDTTTALGLLASWNGDMAADSPAAAVFVLWLTDMQRRVAEAAAPNSVDASLGRGFAPAALIPYSLFAFGRTGHLVRLLQQRPDDWFESWNDAIRASLAVAEGKLRSRFGSDTSSWAWGTVRPLTLSHPVGLRKPLDRVFNLGPMPWSGDFTTVAQAGAPPLDPMANPLAIASLRMAVDVGEWDRSRFSLPGGQSGNPMSPHYSDQLDSWRLGLGVHMPWNEASVAAATRETLHLTPLAG